jgi:hypothetical protein
MPRLDANLADVKDEDMGGGGWRAFKDGEYVFHVLESDYRPTKAKNGMVLELVYECIDPAAGRSGKVYEYLCLEHPKSDVVRIAKAKLKELAIAVGHQNPDFIRASEELHNRPFILKVKRVKAEEGFGDDQGMKNEAIGYVPMGSQRPRTAAANGDEPPPHDDADIPF